MLPWGDRNKNYDAAWFLAWLGRAQNLLFLLQFPVSGDFLLLKFISAQTVDIMINSHLTMMSLPALCVPLTSTHMQWCVVIMTTDFWTRKCREGEKTWANLTSFFQISFFCCFSADRVFQSTHWAKPGRRMDSFLLSQREASGCTHHSHRPWANPSGYGHMGIWMHWTRGTRGHWVTLVGALSCQGISEIKPSYHKKICISPIPGERKFPFLSAPHLLFLACGILHFKDVSKMSTYCALPGINCSGAQVSWVPHRSTITAAGDPSQPWQLTSSTSALPALRTEPGSFSASSHPTPSNSLDSGALDGAFLFTPENTWAYFFPPLPMWNPAFLVCRQVFHRKALQSCNWIRCLWEPAQLKPENNLERFSPLR